MRTMVFAIMLVMSSACAVLAAELPSTLVDPYVRVQTALAADKTDSIKQDATEMATAAAALGAPADGLREAAERLQRAGDLKAARLAFEQLSDALFAYAKATGAANPAGVRTAFCPMVNKSWLQRGDSIRNPYFGSEMLECGEWKK